jgi:hypothetical protein
LTACPLCKGPEDVEAQSSYDRDVSRVKCVRCGTFEVAGIACALYENQHTAGWEQNRHLLSGRARNATIEGRVEHFELEDFGAAEHGELTEKSTEEQILLMLRWFDKSAKRGQWLTPEQSRDYPVAYCRDGSEWSALLWDVVKEKWLDKAIGDGPRLEALLGEVLAVRFDRLPGGDTFRDDRLADLPRAIGELDAHAGEKRLLLAAGLEPPPAPLAPAFPPNGREPRGRSAYRPP